MRNVMLLTSSLVMGGAERVIGNLVEHFDQDRFRVTVAHLKERGGIGDQLLERGHDVIGIPRTTQGVGRYLSFRALRKVVRERQIELLHTHTTYALSDGALCRLAGLRQVKLVHTFHFGNYPHLSRRYLMMERFGARAASHLVAVGIEQMGVLQSLYGIAPGRMSAILNGVNQPAVAVDREWEERLRRDGRVVIGTTATFIEQKGLGYLLDVAHLIEKTGGGAVFVVVGDGGLRSSLEERCRAMGLDRTVLFAGWKPNADATMTPLYDVLLQPSLWEAMSMVVLEAMAVARPVVVTDVGDNRHVVVEGVTGFVVPPRDTEAMADRLRTLISSEPLRRQLGDAGKERHQQRYTAAAMTRAYEQLFDRVLEDPPPHPAR
jgi:glycosyltransferase involved in cell wall biosynthesis